MLSLHINILILCTGAVVCHFVFYGLYRIDLQAKHQQMSLFRYFKLGDLRGACLVSCGKGHDAAHVVKTAT